MMSYEPPIHKTVRDWLGLSPFDTDKVVTALFVNAERDGIDLDEASTATIRKLADDAFQELETEGWGL